MKHIIQFSIFLIFGISYSQILPENQVTFENVLMYSKVGTNNFGKLLANKNATAEIIVFSSGIQSIISFETSLIDGSSQLFQVKMSDKDFALGLTTYSVSTFNLLDPEKKTIDFILFYEETQIKKFIMLTKDGAVEFY